MRLLPRFATISNLLLQIFLLVLALYRSLDVDGEAGTPEIWVMLARVRSACLIGIEAALVSVEVDVTPGLPAFTTVGLPDSTVRESRDRVRAAIKNAGFAFPQERLTVSLAPAELRKEGAAFDLPIALGILAATGTVKREPLEGCVALGELALDGEVRAVRGVLPVTLACRSQGVSAILLPRANALEARVVEGVEKYPVSSLRQAVEFLNGERMLEPVPLATSELLSLSGDEEWDFSEVRGQAHAVRALEIAAAGGHNLLEAVEKVGD